MVKEAQPPGDPEAAAGGAANLEPAQTSIQTMTLAALIDSVRDYAIFMLDPDGKVLTWNTGARAIKGYEASDIIGSSFERFYTPEDRAHGKPARLLRIAREEGRVEDESWRLRKDGTRFWADVVLTAIHDGQGRLRGYVKVTRDLTQRREAEEQLRRSEMELRYSEERLRRSEESLSATLYSLGDAVIATDERAMVTRINPVAARMTGWTEPEAVGRPVDEVFRIVSEETRKPAENPVQRVLSEGIVVGLANHTALISRDGTEHPIADSGAPIRDRSGAVIGVVLVFRDVTDERTAERALRESEERLRLTVDKLTREIAERTRMEQEVRDERGRTAEAQTAVKERDEFISVAAHELRTPLTALQLKLEGLENLLKKSAADMGALSLLGARVDGAIKQTERLSVLVERLLDVSRIVAGQLEMKLEEVDLSELVKHAVDDIREAALQAGSELRFLTSGPVVGAWDRTRLGQVMTNLLSNAVKYGEAKPVDVRVSTDEQRALVVVSDHGIGISPADVERIFGRFERAAPLRHYSGLGLGLYITRYIVEAHGGSVKVDSREGAGSTFLIDLPLRPPPPADAPPS